MPLGIVLGSVLLAFLIVAYISYIGGGKISLKLVIAWLRAELTVDQPSKEKPQSGRKRFPPESRKNKYPELKKCWYCGVSVRADRINDHNRKCPKRPRPGKRQNVKKPPSGKNTPFG